VSTAPTIPASDPRATAGARATVPQIPPPAIAGVTVLLALACGRFFADGRIKYGAALVLAALYTPLVFFDLPAAFALFTSVQFVKDIRAFSIAPNTMGVLVGVGFIGVFVVRGQAFPALMQHRRLILGVAMFVLWLTISSAWAPQPGTALSEAGFYWLGALAFLIVITTLARGRDIALVALAFVVGATAAAVIGLGNGGLSTAAADAGQATATAVQGRLTGGGGDPNLQAAGFIAAIFLAMGLLRVYRGKAARTALTVSFSLLTVAFFATESRGGLLALAVSTIAALVLFPDQRRRVLGFVTLGAVIAAAVVATNPGSLSRITNFSGGTSGRSDIWSVATKVFSQHPLVGVGLDNFQAVEPRFALMHRSVSRVTYIAETPFPAHNTYLQLLADNGLIGLAGFLAIVVACLNATQRAARMFDYKALHGYANLARAVLLGTIGMLTAIFFFTDGDDWRLWILLGLGPALLTLARAAPLTTTNHER
jgi:O-antigen ligase